MSDPRTDPPLEDDDDFDSHIGPWCRAFTAHREAHRFCSDHQGMFCLICDRNGCPECVDDPHCPECHCSLFEDYHDWDCSYAD